MTKRFGGMPESSLLLDPFRADRASAALLDRYVGAFGGAGVDLPRAADALLGVVVHLGPMGDPAGEAAHGEERGRAFGESPKQLRLASFAIGL